MTDSDDSIEIRFTFPSPEKAVPIANALVAAGFPDVRLHVVLEARATGADSDLQQIHDRMKELGPMIEAAQGPDTQVG